MLLPDKHGVAILPALEKVKEATGVAPPELQEYYDLPFPEEMFSYWQDFLEINKKRTRGESGDNPISLLEIDAWARLTETKPTQLWLDVISMLDVIWLRTQAELQK